MSNFLSLRGGVLNAVYDDRLMPLFAALGKPQITRASEVEFDHASGEWVAIHVATGAEIARGSNRNDVIAAEVRWLEGRL